MPNRTSYAGPITLLRACQSLRRSSMQWARHQRRPSGCPIHGLHWSLSIVQSSTMSLMLMDDPEANAHDADGGQLFC